MQVVPAEIPESLSKGVWLVVPAYREARVVGEVVRSLRSAYPNVVVVDDGSGDATAERAREAGAVVLRHLLNRGQGAALQTGLEYALSRGAEQVVTFDADGQHHPGDVARLLAPILAGEAEVTLGSRFLGDADAVPRPRRLLLAAAVLFTRVVSGVRLTDAHNGLRGLSRAAAARLDLRLDRMAHASEIIDQLQRAHLRVREVPVRVRYSAYSREKGQGSGQALRVAVDYLVGRILR